MRISRKISLCATAAALVLETLTASAEEAVLRIAKQGSMEAGGKSINCATNDGGDANSTRWPSGHVVIDQVYASFQYPADRRYPYPILFNSGGGHTARVYDTTPDGREGWLTLFLREGFPVYGVDRPNTGRSGTDICKINAVKLGKAPIGELPAINRYAAESSWVTFRWGPKFGEPYPNTQFPIAAADNYYPQTVSTYRDPEETQQSVAAFAALIDKIPDRSSSRAGHLRDYWAISPRLNVPIASKPFWLWRPPPRPLTAFPQKAGRGLPRFQSTL